MAETWTFSRPDKTLTEAEKRLIAASAAGGVADCADLPEAEKRVSAELIVALGTGQFNYEDWPADWSENQPKWKLHDRGLKLSHAIIPERVQGQERRFDVSLVFVSCQFKQAVDFANSSIEGRLYFDECHLTGESCFLGAEIACQFSANGGIFENPDGNGGFGRAVLAQDVKAAGWFMKGTKVKGEFNITGAEIAGQFGANNAVFENLNGAGGFGQAVFAQGVKVAGWFMDGAKVKGAFNINSAEITTQFRAEGATFEKPDGKDESESAVFAQRVKATEWFMASAKVKGEFCIAGATLSGQFCAGDATFENPGGRAINAEYARITGGVWLADAEGKKGSTIKGGASFADAEVGTRLQLAGSSFNAGAGTIAINLLMVRITGRLVMPDQPVSGIIDLSRAHAATLVDAAFSWPKPLALDCRNGGRQTREVEGRVQDIEHMVLDGFTYDHIEYPAGHPDAPASAVGKARIDWLNGQSAQDLKQHFNPQPWRQMAKVLREMGYEEAAQEVSIARRVRERHADGVGWFERFINWFLENVADYGFNPWKTVRISGYFVVLSAFIYWGGAGLCGKLEAWDSVKRLACSGQPAFVQTKFNDFEERVKLDKEGKPIPDPNTKDAFEKERPGYPAFNPLAYSMDVFLPLLDIQSEGYWRANTKAYWRMKEDLVLPIGFNHWRLTIGKSVAIGWLLYLWSVFEVFMGSILIAIAVTGFTGLLTRDEK